MAWVYGFAAGAAAVTLMVVIMIVIDKFVTMRRHRSMLPQICSYRSRLTRQGKAKGNRSGMSELAQFDYSGAFAVPDTEPWWRAVNQIVDQAELETIVGARSVTHDPNRCLAAVGAGEGCDLIRTKLKEARNHALTSYRNDIKPK